MMEDHTYAKSIMEDHTYAKTVLGPIQKLTDNSCIKHEAISFNEQNKSVVDSSDDSIKVTVKRKSNKAKKNKVINEDNLSPGTCVATKNFMPEITCNTLVLPDGASVDNCSREEQLNISHSISQISSETEAGCIKSDVSAFDPLEKEDANQVKKAISKKQTKLASVKRTKCVLEKRHVCSVCEKQFGRLSHLKEHILFVHNGSKPYKCESCQKAFSTKTKLDKHKQTHLKNLVYFCATCQQGFSNFTEFRLHQVIHIGQKPQLQCGICNELFERAMLLQDHLKIKHSVHSGRSSQLLLECSICGKGLSRKDKLLSHMQRFHEDALCSNEKITGDTEWIESWRQKQGTDEKQTNNTQDLKNKKCRTRNSDVQNLVECAICHKTFIGNVNLKMHQRIHISDINKSQCDICLQKFTSLAKLKRHELSHQGIKTYSCRKCDIFFTEREQLKKHIMIHVYECTVCHKQFGWSSQLQKHFLCHSGEKPHLCDTCNKAYRLKSDLERHINTHFNVNLWACTVCNKQFNYKTCLVKHMEIHGTEKYFCDECGASFKQQSVLRRHTQIHSGIKPFMCEKCGWRFARPEHLRNHIRTHSKKGTKKVTHK